MRRIDSLVIHQSASIFGDAATIDAWHKQRGWSGIGYHRVILNGKRTAKTAYNTLLDGKIEPGRPDEKAGAHAPGYNQRSLGICLIGNGPAFGPKGYMTRRQWAVLVDACARLCQRHGIRPSAIIGHRNTETGKRQGKTCPGFGMEALRWQVGQRLADASYQPSLPSA